MFTKNKNKIKLTLLFLTGFIILGVFFSKPNIVRASPITETKLIQLANQERKTRGLVELKLDPILYFAAKSKAQDMLDKDYFEHYSLDGKSPWDFIHSAGYDYQKAGENLAMDFATSEGIHDAWMASETHKNNILKPEYEDIAIATYIGDFNGKQTTMVVEMFGKPMPEDQYSAQSLIINVRNFILGF